MKIAVLTVFHNLDRCYSLTNIVLSQLRLIKKKGHQPILITLDKFKEKIEGVEIRNVIPTHTLVDYQEGTKKHKTFDKEVQEIRKSLRPALSDIDKVFTHDIMFQGWFLTHNTAVRELAKDLPDIKWFHWLHSAPSERPKNLSYPLINRYSDMDNSTFIYLNYTDIPRVAKMYNIPQGKIRVVYNSIDPKEFYDMHPVAKELIDKHSLLSPEILIVYPIRLSEGKQPDKAIKLAGKLNQLKPAKLVFCNSYSNADKEKQYILELRKTAVAWGLPQNSLVFTSEAKNYELGIPHRAVRNLLSISNVFVFTTKSEACSLILLEAVMGKNLVLLNEDFPALREFGEHFALYGKFSSTLYNTHYSDEDKYYEEKALEIKTEMENNKVLGFNRKIITQFNDDWIWKNQIEPLLT